MSDYQVVSVGFGPGLDTKTDPKFTAKPVLLKDGIFTSPKRVSKRNGYDNETLNIVGGGTISNPTMVKSFKNELVCAGSSTSGPRLFSYSGDLGAWSDQGKYASVAVSKNVVHSPLNGAVNSSVALSGNIALYSYDIDYLQGHVSSENTTSYISVVDVSTGAHLLDSLQITNSLGWSKAVLLGASTLGVLYISSTSSNLLAIRIISVTSSGVSVGSEVAIGTCLADSGVTPKVKHCYDAVATSSGLSVLVANEPNINIYNLDTAGATTASATMTGAGSIAPVNVTLDPSSGNLWCYWCDVSTAIYYQVFSSSLSVVLAKTSIDATKNTNIQQIVAYPTSATLQTVYYSQYSFVASVEIGVIYPSIFTRTVNTSGTVGSIYNFLLNADIYGKPFSNSGSVYMPCMALSATAPTGFLVDTLDGIAVAKFQYQNAEGLYGSPGSTSGNSAQTATYKSIRYSGFLNTPVSVSSGKFLFVTGFQSAETETVSTSSTTLSFYPSVNVNLVTGAFANTFFDFSNIDAYRSLVSQDTLVLNGGIVSHYVGSYVSELGFNVIPDGVTGSAASTGGSIGAGTYLYYATYSWIDSAGNLYESAPSIAAVLFVSGTTNEIVLKVPTLALTQKQNVRINIYRTENDGQIAYLIVSKDNDKTVTSVSFTDGNSDSALVLLGGGTLYTQGDAVLPNIAPPPSMVLWANINRVWCLDSENPETTLEYSKTASKGTGISFSTGLLEYLVDSRAGAITGASPMDEKTVLIKENGLGYFVGDGANDSGGGSTLTAFQFIPSDTGGSNSGSVVLFPDGILFRASNNKGIYKLSRGTQVSYFGMGVEAYNAQDIRSAFIVPNRNQIRFLTSSGSSLLYDYVMGQWSIFTNHQGLSADQYNGLYVYARTDGKIYLENETSFLDDTSSYSVSATLQWIKATSEQDFYRIRRLMMLGDYENGSSQGHGVQISTAYDFGTSFSQPVPYLFGESSSSGSFQYRERLSQQKCDAIQLLIEEIVTGASGEYCDFTDLGIEISSKRGLNKLPQFRSVG